MSDRPKLTGLEPVKSVKHGVVVAGPRGERDWAGPFQSGARAMEVLDELLAGHWQSGTVVAWDGRQQALARVMGEHEIHPSGDYDFDHLLDVLAGSEEAKRFGAVRSDETYSIVTLFDTAKEAAADLESSVGQEYLNQPVGVLDLDSGKLAKPRVSVAVDFDG